MTSRLVPTSAAMAIQRLASPKTARSRTSDLGHKGDRDVLADAGERRPAEANEPGEPAEIVGQEDDVGRFEGGPAGDAARARC